MNNFGCVIFRRNTENITREGGLWDTSEEIYPHLGGVGSSSGLYWSFPSGATIKMSHMLHEKNRLDWHGSQIPVILWDELTEFTEKQFFYMFSRNRSATGIRGYQRATCNADADSWVAKLISWYIDQRTGLPIPERSGVIRWFVRVGDKLEWGASRDELVRKFPQEPKSFTFIASKITDNQIGMQRDPAYLSNLQALPTVDRERLLTGNWKIKPSAGSYFKRSDFAPAPLALPIVRRTVRVWDRAATEKRADNDPDWTRGLKLCRDEAGMFYVEHLESCQRRPSDVDQVILNTARMDGNRVEIVLLQDPGSAGVHEVESTVRLLAGFTVHVVKLTRDKETNAKPASSQAGANNIKLSAGGWNEDFLIELENFPEWPHDDIVDTLANGINFLATGGFRFQRAVDGQNVRGRLQDSRRSTVL